MSSLKKALYYLLLYARTLFIASNKLLSILFVLCAIILFLIGNHLLGFVTLLALSFGTFMLRQFYDFILLKLTPENIELTLSQ